MSANTSQSAPAPTFAPAPVVVALCLLAAAVLTVAWPLTGALLLGLEGGVTGWPGLNDAGGPARLLARTVAVALGVGLLSTLLGLPFGFTLRASGARSRWLPFVALPLIFPSWLLLAGLNVIRGPGTLVGDSLMRADPSITTRLGDAFALLSLGLAGAPLAGVVLSLGLARVSDPLLDGLTLDGAGRLRRTFVSLRIARSSVLAAIMLVAAATLGSAVPLHLAQIQTYSIWLWKLIDLSPSPIPACIAAAPLVVVTGLLALCAGLLSQGSTGSDAPDEPTNSASQTSRLLSAGMILLATLLPCALLTLLSAGEGPLLSGIAERVGRFVVEQKAALIESAAVAFLVGLSCTTLLVGSWYLAGFRRGPLRWTSLLVLGIMLIGGLGPGVVIGAAIRITSGATLSSSTLSAAAGLVLAHIARFGFIPLAAGMWLARTEDPASRALRLTDGATGLIPWCRAVVLEHPAPVVATFFATAGLSLFEIESAIMLQPPGVDSLARVLLDKLH
ncbi:MAG: hypothetical protein ACT4PL_09520, partial [Phycisphaerales bacterium]